MTTNVNSTSKKRLLLGVTGGVAAYKVAELARLLTQNGIDVRTIMTESAHHFVGPETFQSLTGNPVYSDLWGTNAAANMAHINLSRNADMILVAPASANFIAKLASGIADDLLTTLCLARDCRLMIAPAMNRAHVVLHAPEAAAGEDRRLGLGGAGARLLRQAGRGQAERQQQRCNEKGEQSAAHRDLASIAWVATLLSSRSAVVRCL